MTMIAAEQYRQKIGQEMSGWERETRISLKNIKERGKKQIRVQIKHVKEKRQVIL